MIVTKKGLGKGLGALIPSATEQESGSVVDTRQIGKSDKRQRSWQEEQSVDQSVCGSVARHVRFRNRPATEGVISSTAEQP